MWYWPESGTRDWNNATKLDAFRDQLADKFAQHGTYKILPRQTGGMMTLTSLGVG